MMYYREAQRMVLRAVSFRKIRRLSLREAFGMVLAEDVRAPFDGPGFDKAVMDGYALKSFNARRSFAVLKLVEDIPAGKKPEKSVKRGEAAKISTGAMIPRGADAVAKREDALLLPAGRVMIFKTMRRKENLLCRGAFFRKGRLLLRKGSLLKSAEIALLSSLGLRGVRVFVGPRVSILCTGREVVEPPQKKRMVQVFNATANPLVSALKRMRCRATYLGLAPDTLAPLVRKIKKGLAADILIICGAVSVGDYDLVPDALKKAGARTRFAKVSMKPGRPFLFASRKNCLIFCLPGNPVSALVTFSVFVLPVVRKALGFKKAGDMMKTGFLSKGISNFSSRTLFSSCYAKEGKDGRVEIALKRNKGSADLSGLSGADAVCVLEGKKVFPQGAKVLYFEI